MGRTGRQKEFKGEVVSRLSSIARSGVIVYVNRTDAERLEVARRICNLYSTGRYTLSAICEHFHVKLQSFNKWSAPSINIADLMIKKQPIPKGCIPQVNQWYLEAKKKHNAAFLSILDERAKVGLMLKVEGREWEEVTEEEEWDEELQDYKVIKRKTKKGRDAPDTAAIIFTLTNTDPDRFKNTGKFQQTTNIQNNTINGLEGMSDEELHQKLQEKKAELLEIEAQGTKTEFISFDNVDDVEDEEEPTNLEDDE